MDDIAVRIFKLVKTKGLEQKQFAALIRKTDKTVSAWATGRSHSYTKCLPEIANALGTTPEYLLTGETPKPTAVGDGLSEAEQGLLDLFRRLAPEQQEMVVRMVQAAAESL